ncbi:MAG: hypothetical protein WC803_11020 [Sphingomonas sp.]|jgi:hypothetical protein
MFNSSLPAAVLLILFACGPADGQARVQAEARGERFILRQRIIIRVPRPAGAAPAGVRNLLPVENWQEKKRLKCVPLNTLAGASQPTTESVDLVTTEGKRLRARFDDGCPALDFYGGFYIRPTDDGQVCARRDVIRARSGGTCQIKEIRLLAQRR